MSLKQRMTLAVFIWLGGLALNCAAIALAGPRVLFAILGTAFIGGATWAWVELTERHTLRGKLLFDPQYTAAREAAGHVRRLVMSYTYERGAPYADEDDLTELERAVEALDAALREDAVLQRRLRAGRTA
jgi:hypothetical protein